MIHVIALDIDLSFKNCLILIEKLIHVNFRKVKAENLKFDVPALHWRAGNWACFVRRGRGPTAGPGPAVPRLS